MIQLSDYLTTQEPHVNELVSKFISKRLYDIIEPMTDYDIDGLNTFFLQGTDTRRCCLLLMIFVLCSKVKISTLYR